MPTKLKLEVKVGDEWVDYSDAVSKDYTNHRTMGSCKWYADKISGVVSPDQFRFTCSEQKIVSNTNFLYAPPPSADLAPGVMLISFRLSSNSSAMAVH